MVQAPNLAPGRTDALVELLQVTPTVLELFGLEPPYDLDGRSRWRVIRDQVAQPPADYITIGQTGEQAYYQWPWKLIALEDSVELYDLERDPLETSNVAARHPERTAELERRLAEAERAPTVHIPLWRVVWDPDFFGGEEDRPPWADVIE